MQCIYLCITHIQSRSTPRRGEYVKGPSWACRRSVHPFPPPRLPLFLRPPSSSVDRLRSSVSKTWGTVLLALVFDSWGWLCTTLVIVDCGPRVALAGIALARSLTRIDVDGLPELTSEMHKHLYAFFIIRLIKLAMWHGPRYEKLQAAENENQGIFSNFIIESAIHYLFVGCFFVFALNYNNNFNWAYR